MRFRIIILLTLFLNQPAGAETLRRGIGPEPDSLHIHQAQGLSAIHLLREIREGLVTFNAKGEPVAGSAESWEISDEGKRYLFKIRENARWSNGDEVTAQDFVRGWTRAVNPESASRNASLLAAVENSTDVLMGKAEPSQLGIKAIDELTLEVRLSYRQEWFLEILTHPVTYPLHRSDTGAPRAAVVNGPFVIEKMTPRAIIRLARNPHFHSADAVKLDALELFPIEDPSAELSRFRSGELHLTETIPPGRYKWLQENLPAELTVSPYLGSFWLGYNLSKPPFKGNANLRKALSLAIDRKTLVKVVLGAGELPAYSIVPPGLESHQEDPGGFAIADKTQRETRSRVLFAEAGYGPANPLRIEVRYNTSSQHRRMAVAVTAMWKQVLGVASVLINEEWKVFVNNRSQGFLTQVFRGGWIADYADPASFLDLFRSGDAMNWSSYTSPQYDQLLDQASLVQGSGRIEILKKAEALLMRDMPVIPLYYYVSRHLVDTKVTGFESNVRDIHLSRYMDINTGAR
jgi:oligopeptide transport system substrate-binding protein